MISEDFILIFGKHINRYYIKHGPLLLVGIAALIFVDYFQLILPELYRIVVNGMNGGLVEVDGVFIPFTIGATALSGTISQGSIPCCSRMKN